MELSSRDSKGGLPRLQNKRLLKVLSAMLGVVTCGICWYLKQDLNQTNPSLT